MKVSTSLKSLVGAVALTAIASVASAATVTFADMTVSGAVNYTAEKNFFGFTIPATGSASGALAANRYGNTSVVRDYTLEYNLYTTWDGTTRNLQGAYAIPISFSIDSIIATLPSVPSTPGGALPIPPLGGVLTYSGLNVTHDTLTGAFTFGFLDDSLENLLAGWGVPEFSGDFSGSYTAELALVADVPLPAAAPLLVVGIGGLVAFGRKRRKAAA